MKVVYNEIQLCDGSKTPHYKWILKIRKGLGAGYISGWTFYICWKSVSAIWQQNFRGKKLPLFYPLEIGITQNANIIPYI